MRWWVIRDNPNAPLSAPFIPRRRNPRAQQASLATQAASWAKWPVPWALVGQADFGSGPSFL
jgi:hypothetical protein